MEYQPLELYGFVLSPLAAWQNEESGRVLDAVEQIAAAFADAHDSADPELGRLLFRRAFAPTYVVRVRRWTTSVFGLPPPFPQGAAWGYRDHIWAADAVFRQADEDVAGAFMHELGHVWDTRNSWIGSGSLSIAMMRAVQAGWASRLGAPAASVSQFLGSRGPWTVSRYSPGPRALHPRADPLFAASNQYQDWAEAFKWWVLTRDRRDPYAAEPGGRWEFVQQQVRRVCQAPP